MNYRHAFHAGNFADVMKHALLVRILAYLQRKETPLRVIDTHAGIGLYDLTSDEAGRTGEWVEGIGRLDEAFSPEVEEILAPYRAVIADVRARHGETCLSRLARHSARAPAAAGSRRVRGTASGRPRGAERGVQRGHQSQGDASRRLDGAPCPDSAEGEARPRSHRPALRGAERARSARRRSFWQP